MPNMLDYERLVRQNADLRVENAKLKGDYKVQGKDDERWNWIERQPLTGAKKEELRLRLVIRDWEERYDILSELYAQRELNPTAEWHQVKAEREARQRFKTEIAARRQYRAYWLQLIVDKLKSLTKWRVK
jgi:hypothetical protein